MTRFLYDTAVFVYALGAVHPYRDPCRELVRLAGTGALVGDASVELVQELAHVRARRLGDRQAAVLEASAVADLCHLQAVEEIDLRLALRLVGDHEDLDVRDGIHAATALNRGIEVVVSPDRVFDLVPGLRRLDPADAVEVLLPG